ncbi:competence/damage-inducible protein A [Adhaeribacter sp. BT258]|uniref:CinA-like protein n=1 Tax=Adhaeribacter terrigena TaxID=2793070 RepID=A0ABS1BYT3_9BACT|nr:competence/damage-inducible protein A [Adhaeribacter terrigena]MBK0402239.1 competence/damage-inducible protein A [Adhaeribacter terrigena]
MKPVLAEIITIGDEILYGQIVDTNSAWLGTELGKIGVRVKQISSIADEAAAITQAVIDAQTRADLILITGGLGPTRDDITKKTLAEYFGCGLKLDPQSLEDVTDLFQKRGRELTEANRQQAFLPENCTPIRNPIGTAPGMWFEHNGKIIVSMPGVPYEMMHMMTEMVIPRIQAAFEFPVIIHKVIQTIGIGESFLAEQLSDWEDALPPHIKLAYLPHLAGVRLRLTGHGTDPDELEDQLLKELSAVSTLISKFIYAYGEVTLEETIGMLLNARSLTISTAESCTGGHVAHKLTSIPGSSMYYMGSIIAYDNDVKIKQLQVKPETIEQYGAVSEAVVREMAENVRKIMGTDVGIATSGIAGPGGGTEEKPVGTLCIAYADATKTISKKLFFNKDRELNIEFTAMTLLNLVRQSLP